jgi:hypothetical protein
MIELEVGRKEGYSPTGRLSAGKRHAIYLSDLAWENLDVLAQEYGYPSRSAFLEAIAMGQVELVVRATDGSEKIAEELTTPIVPEE